LKPTSVSLSKEHSNIGVDRNDVNFVVTELPQLNLLGRNVIVQFGMSIDYLLYPDSAHSNVVTEVKPVNQCIERDTSLQVACKQLCDEFPDLFKSELGCLKDFELDVKFKSDTTPIFCIPHPVPFALHEDLSHAYDQGIARGVWKPVQFNDYGTPVVPIKKSLLPGQTTPSLRVCGD